MKYRVKNCPALRWSRRHFKCCNEYLDFKKCEDREDCLIKQIVELCKIYKNMNATTTEDYAKREVALW